MWAGFATTPVSHNIIWSQLNMINPSNAILYYVFNNLLFMSLKALKSCLKRQITFKKDTFTPPPPKNKIRQGLYWISCERVVRNAYETLINWYQVFTAWNNTFSPIALALDFCQVNFWTLFFPGNCNEKLFTSCPLEMQCKHD